MGEKRPLERKRSAFYKGKARKKGKLVDVNYPALTSRSKFALGVDRAPATNL